MSIGHLVISLSKLREMARENIEVYLENRNFLVQSKRRPVYCDEIEKIIHNDNVRCEQFYNGVLISRIL